MQTFEVLTLNAQLHSIYGSNGISSVQALKGLIHTYRLHL